MEVWFHFLNRWGRTLSMLVKILEVLLRDGSDLEDEGSEEECLKFKKVIWTVFIMSYRRKAVS